MRLFGFNNPLFGENQQMVFFIRGADPFSQKLNTLKVCALIYQRIDTDKSLLFWISSERLSPYEIQLLTILCDVYT